jgi:ABC-type sugar transport system substrate-binding protein
MLVGLVSSCTKPSSTTTTQTTTPVSSELDAFKAKVNALIDSLTQPHLDMPPKGPPPVTGKSILYIPYSMTTEGAARMNKPLEDACKLLGWNYTMIDPGGAGDQQAAALEKAISLKVDAVIVCGLDPLQLTQPFKALKAAGIPCVSNADVDIPDKVFRYSDFSDPSQFMEASYVLTAWAWKKTDYNLKMIMFTDAEFATTRNRRTGAEQFIQDCKAAGGDAEILVQREFAVADLSTTLGNTAVTTVRNYPDYNCIWVPYDGAAQFIISGLENAGLADLSKSFLVAFDANVANMQIMRNNGYEEATIAMPMGRIAYALIDQLNRIFNGQEPLSDVQLGLYFKLMTKQNLPASGAWEGDIDSFTAYKTNWGK